MVRESEDGRQSSDPVAYVGYLNFLEGVKEYKERELIDNHFFPLSAVVCPA